MIHLLFLLLSCIFAVGSMQPTQCEDGAITSDQFDNQWYYLCEEGQWKERRHCPDGLVFDGYSECHLDCSPPEDCPDGQYIQNNCDCTKFYQCDNGVAVSMQCGEGTAFNPERLFCDYIQNVELCKAMEPVFVVAY